MIIEGSINDKHINVYPEDLVDLLNGKEICKRVFVSGDLINIRLHFVSEDLIPKEQPRQQAPVCCCCKCR